MAQTEQLIVKLVDQLTGPARAISRTTESLQRAQAANRRELAQMQGQMLGAVGAGYALARSLAAPVQAAMDFEQQMASVATLVDTSTESIDAMGASVLDIAERVPVAVSDLTGSLYDVRSAGIAAADSMNVLEGSARLAIAGQGRTTSAVDLVTSSINSFNLAGEEQARIYDVIFKAVKNGKTTIDELAQGFGGVAGQVDAANIKVDEYFASVAALTTTGMPAAQAHTQIRAAITGLTRETEQSKAVFDALGADTFKGLVEQSGGMVAAFSRIREVIGDDDAALLKLVGSTEGMNSILGLTDGQNQAFVDTLDDMRNGANAVDEAFDKMSQTAGAMMQRLTNQVQLLGIGIGNALLPALQGVINVVTPLIGAMTDFANANPQATTAVVALAGGLIAARVASIALRWAFLFMKGGLIDVALFATRAASAMLFLLNPLNLVRVALIALRFAVLATGIGLALAGIALAGLWIYNNWSGLAAFFKGFGKAFMGAIEPIMPALEPVLEIGGQILEWVENIISPVEDSADAWESWGEALGVGVLASIRRVIGWLRDLPHRLTETTPAQWRDLGARMSAAIVAGMRNIGAAIQQLVEEVVPQIEAGIAFVVEKVPEALDWLIGAVDTGIEVVLDIVEGAKPDILVWLKEIENSGNLRPFSIDMNVNPPPLLTWVKASDESGAVIALDFVRGRVVPIVEAVWEWYKSAANITMNLGLGVIDALLKLIRDGAATLVVDLQANMPQWLQDLRAMFGAAHQAREANDAASAAGAEIGGRVQPPPEAMVPARAAGGSVAGGRTYLVGEEGPELFTPGGSGYVHSNADTSGMMGQKRPHVTLNAPIGPFHITSVADVDAVVRRIGDRLRTELAGIQSDIEWS